jgi:hypothetical protein
MKSSLKTCPPDGGEEAFSRGAHSGRWASALFFAAVLLELAFPFTIAAQTTISNLDEGELVTTLEAGGTVTFATDGTIDVTNTITISTNVILDGTGHSITISGTNGVQLFNLPAGLDLTLRNLTLANAVNQAVISYYGSIIPSGPTYGGAIFTQGTMDIEECTFTNNGAQSGSGPFTLPRSSGGSAWGGAIYNSGLLTITNSVFVNNSVAGALGEDGDSGSGYGGAIYNGGGTVILGNVIFSSNTVAGGPPVEEWDVPTSIGGSACGGALCSSGGAIFANNVQMIGNNAIGEGNDDLYYPDGTAGTAYGGAMYIAGGTAAISNSAISNNFALGGTGANGTGGGALGGGIFNLGSTLLTQCILSGNLANGPGNVVAQDFPQPGQGGAVFNDGVIQILNSTISKNVAIGARPEFGTAADGQGGGIYNAGSAQVSFCTISENKGAGGSPFGPGTDGNGWGGAIANVGLVELSNTILSSNFTTGATNYGEAIYNTGAFLVDTNTVVAPNTAGAPPLAYDWQINGTNIAGATSSTFNLTNVQFSDAGTYSLLISNSAELLTDDEILNLPLTNAPTFVLEPVGQVTNLGATVEFDAAAVGFPAPMYQWLFDGTNVPGATSSVFILTNVLQNQSGSYTVTATNSIGSSESPQATLTVNGTILLTGLDLGAAGFRISGEGMAGMNIVIEDSTNLVNWVPVQTNLSPFTFVVSYAPSSPLHFYRAVLAH